MASLYTIYRITNLLNGRKYVGQTICTVDRRIITHRSSAKNGCSMIVCRAIRKYGWENFRVDVLESGLSPSNVNAREEFWINSERSLVPNGYNVGSGGALTERTREKIANSKKGKKLSEATKSKISIAHSGKRLTVEHRRNIGRGLVGRPVSAETRRKISESNRKPKSQSHVEAMVRAWGKRKESCQAP